MIPNVMKLFFILFYFFLGLKKFRVFYSLKGPTFIFFLSFPHIFPCLLLRSRSITGSVLLLSPATTHSEATLSSVLRDQNLFFLFLYQSLSSGLYNSEILQHFGPPLYSFFLFQH